MFGAVGTMQGWSAFLWAPLGFFCSILLLFALNLYVFRRPRAHALLTSISAGVVSPIVAVLFAGYILLSFDEPLGVAVSVIAPVLAVILLIGGAEAVHLDHQKMEAVFLKNRHLRKLPDGILAYDLYWEASWAKDAKVLGFGWRNWFDAVVLILLILALPIGAVAAFTSADSILNIPPQWGMAGAALLVALLLRSAVTAVFGQLTFLRYLERPSK